MFGERSEDGVVAPPSPWAGRVTIAAVHVFGLVLFLTTLESDPWSSAMGFLVIHIYSVLVMKYWGSMERSFIGDMAIVVLSLEYIFIAVLFWDEFAIFPWSCFFGVVLIQVVAFTAATHWKELRQAPGTAWFGVITILIYVILAATAPIIAPFGETEIVGAEYEPWGGEYLLGTDNLGRDMLTRLLYGARNTVAIAFVTTMLAFAMGSLAGLLAATLGGWVDQVMGRIVDVLMSIPTLIFALMILSIVGTSVLSLILVIAVLDSTRVFRLARAVAMNVVVMDFVEVARLRGEGLGWVIQKEILPNIMPPLVAEFGLRFCFVFLFIAALSFLGLGIQPPTADWGSMVRDNATLITFGDITPLLPAAAIALLTVSVNFVVDWFLQQTRGLKE